MTSGISSIAVFDPDAFYPMRSLVEGPLSTLDELPQIERFMRAAILHDEMRMEIAPLPAPSEEEEELNTGPNIIVGFGPVLAGFEELLCNRIGPKVETAITLNDRLLKVATEVCGAGPGNPYYDAHVEFLQRLVNVLDGSGSVICDSPLAYQAELVSSHYPADLFAKLDRDWQEIVREAKELGPLLPPIVAVVLRRAQTRSAIPSILKELRDELSEARNKVWTLLRTLGSARNLKEFSDARRELESVSQAFSLFTGEEKSSSGRILWDLLGSGVGAIAGLVATSHPIGGAIGAAAVPVIVEGVRCFSTLFSGQGAVDLGRRIKAEVLSTRPTIRALYGLLNDSEREKLGI